MSTTEFESVSSDTTMHKLLSARIPNELYSALVGEAMKLHCSVSDIVRMKLSGFVVRPEERA